jgi:hypothetical protein
VESTGCVLGKQDDHLVTIRQGNVIVRGEEIDAPLADLARPIVCPVCDGELYCYRRETGAFLRHRRGSAHEPPNLSYVGESRRHEALKHFVADVYRTSGTWGAEVEQWTESRARKPDVTCRPIPTGRTRRTVGVHRVPTAYEIQLADITDAEMERRTVDHKTDGLATTFWLEDNKEPRQRPKAAAALSLTAIDQVVGVATNADVHWPARDWLPEMDVDKFCAEHRLGRIVWQPDYGVITTEAWQKHLRDGGADIDRRRRAQIRAAEKRDEVHHLSVHGELSRLEEDICAAEYGSLPQPPPPRLHFLIQHRIACPICTSDLPELSAGVHLVLAHSLPSTWAFESGSTTEHQRTHLPLKPDTLSSPRFE